MHSFQQELNSQNELRLHRGKYVFTGQLMIQHHEGLSVPYLIAEAIAIQKVQDGVKGDITFFRVSDLIQKSSSFVDEDGKIIEAHKLYTWPRNLGSTVEWTAAKQSFITDFILNFPIEVISLQDGGVTWKFITPENFKNTPTDIVATTAFRKYLQEQDQYFFLRRPLNNPR